MKFSVFKLTITVFSVIAMILGLLFLGSVVFFSYGQFAVGILFSLLTIASVYIVFVCSCRKIIISEEGVEYFLLTKRYFMKWEDIKGIGLVRTLHGAHLIYITTVNSDEIIYLSGAISENYFVMAYREKAMGEINKYRQD